MKLHPRGKFDNHAKDYRHIGVVPLASAMGSEVTGVDLGNLNDDQFGEIEHALYRHKMIFFRGQKISHTDHERLALRFGEFGTDAYTTGTPGHPNIQPVVKEADTVSSMVFGDGWHTDSPFLARPPSIMLLYGADIPPFGGDTIWANTALADSYLSTTMKAVLAPLKVHMSAAGVMASIGEASRAGTAQNAAPTKLGNIDLDLDAEAMTRGSFHPIVRTHPKTGEKSLYVEETYSAGIEGMTAGEGAALFEFLQAHVTQEALTCRLRWQTNTFAIWDNRCCIHRAFNDYDGYRREMYRATVLGEPPA